VKAIKAGANDYFSKPWDNEKLILEVRRMIEAARLARENTQLKQAFRQRFNLPSIVGKSDRMMKVIDLVAQVAPTRSTILITGETGTGKEVIAKAIHSHSPRAAEMFAAVNASSLSPELLEAALFGALPGAIAGAGARKGCLETANRGTVFIDEVSALHAETQSKLLRLIQEKSFVPLGSSEEVRADVRILAATTADLRRLVEDGRFREDLYYRLNVICIPLPPLRDRKEDVPLLVEHFFSVFSRDNGKFLGPDGRSEMSFDPEAMQILMEYGWPGNVRELENVVERAVVLAPQPVAGADVLPEHVLHASGLRVRRDSSGQLEADASLFERVADFERRTILDFLERHGGSQTETAEALRIPLSTLNQKIKRLEIQVRKAR
jgi:DNA-binding NtrC family response regulator